MLNTGLEAGAAAVVVVVLVVALVIAGDPTGVPRDFREGLSGGAGADGVIVTLCLSKKFDCKKTQGVGRREEFKCCDKGVHEQGELETITARDRQIKRQKRTLSTI